MIPLSTRLFSQWSIPLRPLKWCLLPRRYMSISNVSSDSEALFAFSMSFPWLKSLSTAELEGTSMLYLMKSLARIFSPMKALSLRVFFLWRTFQPITYQLCGFCFEDIARRSRGWRCEVIKPISTLNFLCVWITRTGSCCQHTSPACRPLPVTPRPPLQHWPGWGHGLWATAGEILDDLANTCGVHNGTHYARCSGPKKVSISRAHPFQWPS